MQGRCGGCGGSLTSSDVVVLRNADDGFTLLAYRCAACGHEEVRADDGSIAQQLLRSGARVVGLRRTDAPGPADELLAAFRAQLDLTDWSDVLAGPTA